MPDHVAVREVCDDEIIALVQTVAKRLRDLRKFQFRNGLERNALRGRDADIVLAFKRLLIAAVEPVGITILFGGLGALVLVVTVLPVIYWKINEKRG